MANLAQRYIGSTKNAVASVISAPKVLNENRKASQANADADAIRDARKYPKNVPALDASGRPTDAFKARSVASDAKSRIVKRAEAMKKK